MKKIVTSLVLTIAMISPLISNALNIITVKDSLVQKSPGYYEYATEEADEPFDFNTKDYLPIGFNPHLNLDEYDLEFFAVEEDELFDFNTNDYLPVGFNLNKDILDSIVEITTEKAGEPFDFDTKKYLPKGFNPVEKNEIINEL